MKLDKESLQIAAIGVILLTALLAFWVWFLSEVIANEPEFFIYMLIWLGPIIAIPLLRFVARCGMRKKQREHDDIENNGRKGTAIASFMTLWLLGWPVLLWVFG